MQIKGNGSDGAKLALRFLRIFMIQHHAPRLLGLLKLTHPAFDHEIFIWYKLKAAEFGELHGTLPNQKDMFTFVQYFTCQADGVFDIFYPRNSTRRQFTSAHDGCVKFNFTIFIQNGTLAGVIERVILKQNRTGLHRVQSAPPLLQHLSSLLQNGANAVSKDLFASLGANVLQSSCPSMNHQGVAIMAINLARGESLGHDVPRKRNVNLSV